RTVLDRHAHVCDSALELVEVLFPLLVALEPHVVGFRPDMNGEKPLRVVHSSRKNLRGTLEEVREGLPSRLRRREKGRARLDFKTGCRAWTPANFRRTRPRYRPSTLKIGEIHGSIKEGRRRRATAPAG